MDILTADLDQFGKLDVVDIVPTFIKPAPLLTEGQVKNKIREQANEKLRKNLARSRGAVK